MARDDHIHRFESCQGVWLIDIQEQRFCWLPSGATVDGQLAWDRYCQLELDLARGGFAVSLDEDGMAILRAWSHGRDCRFCRTPGKAPIGQSSQSPAPAGRRDRKGETGSIPREVDLGGRSDSEFAQTRHLLEVLIEQERRAERQRMNDLLWSSPPEGS